VLASLTLNIPFRSIEFILALPAIPPGSPDWARSLMFAMTLDVVAMNFFYMVCFLMALRAVPLFPRMLVFAWTLDLASQYSLARYLGAADGLPASVANALQIVIHGNVEKVMISAFVWLPYLLVSDRVNITFRQRERA
jgi:hypothetical protein